MILYHHGNHLRHHDTTTAL